MITDQLSEMMIRSGRVGSNELEKALAIQEEWNEVGAYAIEEAMGGASGSEMISSCRPPPASGSRSRT